MAAIPVPHLDLQAGCHGRVEMHKRTDWGLDSDCADEVFIAGREYLHSAAD
jgi:hypothetical protein